MHATSNLPHFIILLNVIRGLNHYDGTKNNKVWRMRRAIKVPLLGVSRAIVSLSSDGSKSEADRQLLSCVLQDAQA